MGSRLPGAGWRAVAAAAVLAACACRASVDRPQALAADLPLHLEEHLAAANVLGSEVPDEIPERRIWRFAAPQPGWKAVALPPAGVVRLEPTADALRLSLDATNQLPAGAGYVGLVAVDLPDWRRDDWAEVLVEARSAGVQFLTPLFNLGTRTDPADEQQTLPYLYEGEGTVVVHDGGVHTYRLRSDWSDPAYGEWRDPWRQLLLHVWAAQPTTFDLLSVAVVPKAALYSDTPVGVRSVLRGRDRRRAVFTHAPGRIEYTVRIPEGGRLDAGLSVLQSSRPVTFSVTAQARAAERPLFEETVTEVESWLERSVDLAGLAGETVTLTLETRSTDEGAVALWAAPTLSGVVRCARPNVIFYVIDGGGADLMSVYGYNRRTTPNLERLALEGVVFEHAYSNAGWTKPSTASFMTSLQQSVLGGFLSPHDPIPEGVVTMAEHFHRAGYQTAVLTSNPWAGSFSNLERGTDVFRDHGTDHHSSSSAELAEEFWKWRDDYPGQPYWVHFQTTDVHEPHRPVAPFAGMFVNPERRERFYDWWGRTNLWEADLVNSLAVVKNPANTLSGLYNQRLGSIGANRQEFFDTQRGLYDETMAHQDYQIGRLVEELKVRGEWENTLLVIAADHGHPAGSFSRFGRELFDPPPPDSEGALLDSYRTRVPLIFVGSKQVVAGQRLSQPVSMIDMLPTLLDFAGLPLPEVRQGQSLVPLLRGKPGWEPRPVIIEQLQPVPDRRVFVGHIEMIDGRWGASLEIWPESLGSDDTVRPLGNQRAARPHRPDIPPLLLFDLRSDPFARQNVNDKHPELVEKYKLLLEERWAAHQALARHFKPGHEVALTPDQLGTLRDLGYVH